MYHKYKALLQNMPTRHLLTKIEKGDKLTAQISKLVHVDIVNFFIAATPDEISEVLARASNPNAEDGPYFSDEFAWYSMSLVSLLHESFPAPEICRVRTQCTLNPISPRFCLGGRCAQMYWM